MLSTVLRADVRSIDANLYLWQDEILVSKHESLISSTDLG